MTQTSNPERVTAAVLLIGDELLSGRTRDINLQQIARFLAPLGIGIGEARVVSDVPAHIVASLNDLRSRFAYVFTTGGIGPTNDDRTADAVAEAFGVTIDERADALAIITARYNATGVDLTPARRRMARIPKGASLIANPASGAPGFQLGNVFVMAGVPSIMRAMLEDIGHRLEGGAVVLARTVRGVGLREGEIAEGLSRLAEASPDLDFGSYPWFSNAGYGAHLVVRGTDPARLETALADLAALVRAQGAVPEIDPQDKEQDPLS
jgi:molybdopterin-biosynthesis enzyme MoeA-like protein